MITDPDLQADELHPIPNVELCDVHGERKDGGRDLVVVIGSPLKGDHRSQKRLIEKLKQYLAAIEALRDRGAGNCRVIVKAHHDSDELIFSLLERSRVWVEHENVSLKIAKI
jgi:hypothetical protein